MVSNHDFQEKQNVVLPLSLLTPLEAWQSA